MAEEIIHSQYVYRGKVIKLRLDNVRLPNKHMSVREIVEHPGAAAIVALDSEDRVVMVRQYRAAAGRELWEIPAGTLEEGEDPAVCATRELCEETGYLAGQWESLGFFYSSPGIMTERMYLYLARQLTLAQSKLDEDEDIKVERVPWREVLDKIERGEIMDAKSIVGLLRVWKSLGRA
jgi:ADP-ribose pyrophosphatase